MYPWIVPDIESVTLKHENMVIDFESVTLQYDDMVIMNFVDAKEWHS